MSLENRNRFNLAIYLDDTLWRLTELKDRLELRLLLEEGTERCFDPAEYWESSFEDRCKGSARSELFVRKRRAKC